MTRIAKKVIMEPSYIAKHRLIKNYLVNIRTNRLIVIINNNKVKSSVIKIPILKLQSVPNDIKVRHRVGGQQLPNYRKDLCQKIITVAKKQKI